MNVRLDKVFKCFLLFGLVLGLLPDVVFCAEQVTQIQDVREILNTGEVGEMNKNVSFIIGIVLLLVVPLLIYIWLYNSLVDKEESVMSAWAQVESNYQRRKDLIPSLIKVIAKYLEHERSTILDSTKIRAGQKIDTALTELDKAQRQSTYLSMDKKSVENDDLLDKINKVENAVTTQIRRILVAVETYPELSSADQMIEMQGQLEGAENRINIARMRFNEAVDAFNSAIRRMPATLIASASGFTRKAYFRSDKGSKNAPEIKF